MSHMLIINMRLFATISDFSSYEFYGITFSIAELEHSR